MAEVKDFNSYKKKKAADQAAVALRVSKKQEEETSKNISAPAQKQSFGTYQSQRMRIRVMAVVVVVIILAVISYFSWRDKTYTEAQLISSVNIVDSMEATCMNLNGFILQYSRDGMSLMGATGEVVWNQTYEMQSPLVRTCKDVAAIGDYSGRTIYVVNTKEPLGVIRTNLPVRDFCVASQGVVAAILDDVEVTWICLYDKDGNQLANFRTTMANSGYPLSVDISPSGQLVCISYLTVEAAKTKTNVAFYNFGDVGKNKTDNFVGGYICENSVIPRVQFFDNSHSYAIATDRIMFFSGAEIPQMDQQIMLGDDEILSVWESDEYVAITFAGGSDEGAFRMQVYDKSGKEVYQKYMDQEYSGMLFADNQIIMYGSDAWKVLGTNGNERFEGIFDFTVRAVIPTNVSSRFLLVGSDRIDTVELR